jgi:hypothetical protein
MNQSNIAKAYLQEFSKQFPGSNIELRVPEVGAVQFGPGSKHKRGIPPNVVEIESDIFIMLCERSTTWDEQMKKGNINASGISSNINDYFLELKL